MYVSEVVDGMWEWGWGCHFLKTGDVGGFRVLQM